MRREIRHQLRRLGHHASVVMWSGNNENGIYDDGPDSPYEILDYDTVMHEIIRQDTSRPIWPSSPSTGFASGVMAAQKGYKRAVTIYWNYAAGQESAKGFTEAFEKGGGKVIKELTLPFPNV